MFPLTILFFQSDLRFQWSRYLKTANFFYKNKLPFWLLIGYITLLVWLLIGYITLLVWYAGIIGKCGRRVGPHAWTNPAQTNLQTGWCWCKRKFKHFVCILSTLQQETWDFFVHCAILMWKKQSKPNFLWFQFLVYEIGRERDWIFKRFQVLYHHHTKKPTLLTWSFCEGKSPLLGKYFFIIFSVLNEAIIFGFNIV